MVSIVAFTYPELRLSLIVPEHGLAVQTHGHLPPIVTGLHEEAAADLMARASLQLQTPNTDVVHLCLDVPGMQRSKEYYLKTIEEFFKHCQYPEGMWHACTNF